MDNLLDERPVCKHCKKALDVDTVYGWRHWWSGRAPCTSALDSKKAEPVGGDS
jgi:hypothetical protein